MKFAWFAPSAGDGSHEGLDSPEIPGTFSYLIDVARTAERSGFDSILIPTCTHCADPLVTAAVLLQHTSTLKALIAMRPGLVHPVALVRAINSLCALAPGRVYLNLVSGQPDEAARDGDLLDRPARERRLEECSEILLRLLTEERVSFDGEFYKLSKAEIPRRESASQRPLLFLGGHSSAIKAAAASWHDFSMCFGEAPDVVAGHVRDVRQMAEQRGRSIKCGMGINIIARPSRSEAVEVAQQSVRLASKAKRVIIRAHYARNPWIGQRAIADVKAVDFWISPTIWLGLAQVRVGPVASIVGSYQEVAETIRRFHDVGIDYFSLTGHPHLQEADRIGNQVLALLR